MRHTWLIAPFAVLYAACEPAVAEDVQSSLTSEEAREAVGRMGELARADLFTVHFVEVSTDGTVGDRIEERMQRMRAFFASQAHCTTVSLEGDTVILDFGTLEDECVFRGHTYAGVDAITYDEDVELDRLNVKHEFEGFTNGEITLDGELGVRWNDRKDLRRVATDYTLTDFEGAELVTVHSDHTLTRLDPAQGFWEGGFGLDGSREWIINGKTWTTEMRGIEVLMTDPAPMAGTLRVTNPDGDQMDIRYRKDGDLIFARVIGVEGQVWVFVIHSDGEILEGTRA
jgi:hypothetical protein